MAKSQQTLDREIAASELQQYANAHRDIRIAAYTFRRWASALPKNAEIVAYAKTGRSALVKPYTFARWVTEV